MLCDYHMHSHWSADCSTPLGEQILRAEQLGLEEICLTDHIEINFYRQKEEYEMDLETYRNAFLSIPQGPGRVRVKFGLEAGMPCREPDMKILAERVRSQPFDFVIASCHVVANDEDPYEPVYYEDPSRDLTWCHKHYISHVHNMLKWLPDDCYDVVGHIDYGAKFCPWPGAMLKYEHAPDEIDALYRYIIPKGKAIEINTSTYRKLGKDLPGRDWLRRYVELGGEFVTFGGDAHFTKHIGYRFDEAVQIARDAGVRYYATYDGRKPTFHKL